ncbi:hypothetical protein CBE89_00085 [Corynebacterium striatum]|uniref:Uncharacterized protein n=2 Tax=Corynebacterium striatum TaxID=43770 RepID=A0A2Z2J140_CORST|nr:hypothetical protein CBE89_00085 [Corynebacterium striatum]
MVEQYLLESTARELVRLAMHAQGLDALLVPRQASSGENAGKPPARRGSKPPLSVSIVDLKMETEQLLGRWCAQVASESPESGLPPGRGSGGQLMATRADWLRERLWVIESAVWGTLCCEELVAQARMVEDVVAPADGDVIDPPPFGTARQLARWCRLLGSPMSRSTIQRAVADGRLPSVVAPNGQVLIETEAVLELARLN